MSTTDVLVMKGAERFELAHELRITPAPKLCGRSGRFLRCLSVRRGTSLLTDVDGASHVIERRTDQLPPMHRLWFHPSGACLGYRKSGRIGTPSELFFLNPSGVLLKSLRLPDAVSDVAADLGPWCVGCRDSRLYAFETDGTLLWRRRVRVPAPYSIPGMFLQATAPYLHVGAGGGLVGVAAERRLYVLDRLGHQRWTAKLRQASGVQELTWGPSEVPVRSTLLERLGLPVDADVAKVHTGYLRLAWGKVGSGLIREVEQYEGEARTGAGTREGGGPAGFTVAFAGVRRCGIRVLGLAAFQVAVGNDEGGLELFDGEGNRGLLSLMRRHRHNLKSEQQIRLLAYLAERPALELIYRFKQRLCYLLLKKHKSKKQCQKLIPRFLRAVHELRQSGLAQLVTLGDTLHSWSEEIVRMWRFTRSNGITEGFHNKMETISRQAYGFRNFENYRQRVQVLCA